MAKRGISEQCGQEGGVNSLRVIAGDALTELRNLPSESVHCCVTSPPYWGLRDYGTASWEGGDEECDHVASPHSSMRPERSRATSDTFHGSMTTNYAKDAGTPYREVCGKCGAKRIDSQLGLERTPEEYVAKMVEVFREVRRVLRDDGTLWLNLGDSYSGNNSSTGEGEQRNSSTLKPKDLVGISWRLAFALQADGWWLRQDIIWSKDNPMPESVQDRCTRSHEYLFLLTKSARYFYDSIAIAERSVSQVPKQSKRESQTSSLHRECCEQSDTRTLAQIGFGEGFDEEVSQVRSPQGRSQEVLSERQGAQGDRSLPENGQGPGEFIARSSQAQGANEYDNLRLDHRTVAGNQSNAGSAMCPLPTGQTVDPRSYNSVSSRGAAHGEQHSGVMPKLQFPEGQGYRNRRSVWQIPTEPFPGSHFATFPTALVTPCILAGTSARGCCARCGSPYERIVKRGREYDHETYRDGKTMDGPYAKQSEIRNGILPITQTLGWQAGCKCHELFCATCDIVLECNCKHEQHSSPNYMQAMSRRNSCGQSDSDILQSSVLQGLATTPQNTRVEMQRVPKTVQARKQKAEVLQQTLCAALFGQNQKDNKGICDKSEGLQTTSLTESSDGKAGWLCDGASRSYGESTQPFSQIERDSTSPEREKSRQPTRKFGANEQEGSRPNAETQTSEVQSLSALRQNDFPFGICRTCGNPLELRSAPIKPAIILDCFAGSGTVGAVALELGRSAVLIELNPEYVQLIEQRCTVTVGLALA